MNKRLRGSSALDPSTPVLMSILLLAWPTMLEQILSVAVQYVDSAMVGHLGAHATAAVGATTTLTWLINGSVSALAVGFLAFISREYGAGHYEQAARACAQSMLAAIAAGAIFTVLPLSLSRQIPRWMQVDPAVEADASLYFFILYCPMLLRSMMIVSGTVLRACGDTRTPMLVNTGVNLINVVGNFLLIYPARPVSVLNFSFTMPGAGLGVAGAAIASAVSIALGGLGMLAVLYAHPKVSPRGHSLKPDWTVLRPCLKIALPAALQRFTTSFGYVAFASMINSLGAVSMAAHSIANTAESAFYIPGYGMQTAASTLIGNAYGKQNPERMRRLTQTMLILEVAIMTASGALLFFLAEPMMRLFTSDAQVIALGATVLRMVAVTEPAYGVSIVLEGVFQGVGDTMAPFRFNVIGMWGIRIAGTFVTLRLLGLDLRAAWACMIAHNLALFIMMLRRYIGGRWNPLNVSSGLQKAKE